MRILLILAVLLLASCASTAHKPDLPTAATIVQPRVIYVDRVRYVAIKSELTIEQPIAEGPLSQCPDVGAARKASLKKVNAQLREIHAVQGTEVGK
jgi:hypothetical protein